LLSRNVNRGPRSLVTAELHVRLLDRGAGESSFNVQIEPDDGKHQSDSVVVRDSLLRLVRVHDVLKNETLPAHRVGVELVVRGLRVRIHRSTSSSLSATRRSGATGRARSLVR